MKVLYLPGYRYPASLQEPLSSGDLRYSFTLSRALVSLGYEVRVLTRLTSNEAVISKLDGVTVHRYKSGLSKLFGTSFDISLARFWLFRKMLSDVDLVICNSPLSLEHMLNIKVPIIYIASGLEDVKNYSATPKQAVSYLGIKLLRDPLKKLTWKKAFMVNTTAWAEDNTLLKWGVKQAQISKVSSGVDTSRFYPQKKKAQEIRKKYGIKDTDSVILSVSRFTPAKGILETVQAFDKLGRKNTWLVIVGVQHSHDSSYYIKLLEQIKKSKYKSRILLFENIPEEQLPAFYSMATVTSVFSKGYDPLPTVIIESMSCGTPVVSTYYKTREQFINNGKTGVFVKEADLADWIDKVSDLLDNNTVRENIARHARKHVNDNFDALKIAREYVNMVSNEQHT